jgi:hypothetical protein
VARRSRELLSSGSYGPLVVAYRNGAPVHLSDIAWHDGNSTVNRHSIGLQIDNR